MPENASKPICGVVMPISSMDGCTESHWADVLEILTEAIEDAGFEANLVSNADDVGIIHKRIIQNLYDNPVVVCDVSGKNPNVMFELGLRLAFDKPTVIVKDEKTSYSFDTSAIEHLEYPRDLRFSRIVEFKQKLKDKIVATHARATGDPTYTTFLKHFGEFTVAKLEKKEVPGQQFIIEELRALRSSMRRMEFASASAKDPRALRARNVDHPRSDIDICLMKRSSEKAADLLEKAKQHPGVVEARLWEVEPGHQHLLAQVKPDGDAQMIETTLRSEVSPLRRIVRRPPNES